MFLGAFALFVNCSKEKNTGFFVGARGRGGQGGGRALVRGAAWWVVPKRGGTGSWFGGKGGAGRWRGERKRGQGLGRGGGRARSIFRVFGCICVVSKLQKQEKHWFFSWGKGEGEAGDGRARGGGQVGGGGREKGGRVLVGAHGAFFVFLGAFALFLNCRKEKNTGFFSWGKGRGKAGDGRWASVRGGGPGGRGQGVQGLGPEGASGGVSKRGGGSWFRGGGAEGGGEAGRWREGGGGGRVLVGGGGRARSIFCVFGCICEVTAKRRKTRVFVGEGAGAGPGSGEAVWEDG